MPHFEKHQRNILKNLLQSSGNPALKVPKSFTELSSYEKFAQVAPLTTYEDYEFTIQRYLTENQSRIPFQPTSGSTHKKKWIPYPKELKKEFNYAIAPWIYDLYQKYPKIKSGTHYWSLSWLPDELRNNTSTNDLEAFGLIEKYILNQTMAVPQNLALVKTSQAAQFATLAYLCAREDLTLISVWSPTFALGLLDLLVEKKNELSEVLLSGNWGRFQSDMNHLPCPKNKRTALLLRTLGSKIDEHFLKDLWPQLTLISAWETSSSFPWANKLKSYFPDTHFQGKGLFATEAVVTIPYENDYVLTYQSHFYEFKDLKTEKIYPSWDLKIGQRISPIVSTSSGFFRYQMKDELVVKGFKQGLPCLEFIGRIHEIDFVGEKISPETISEIFKKVETEYSPLKGICAFGIEDQNHPPFYLILFEGPNQSLDKLEKIENAIESLLQEIFHYKLAKDLGQLRKSKIILTSDARKILEQISLKQGMISGNMKPERLMKLSSDILKEIKW